MLVFGTGVLLGGVVYSLTNAVWPSTYAEQFPTRVRLSGMAVGTQFGFAIGGFAPLIETAIVGPVGNMWLFPGLYAVATCLISAIAVSTMRETHKIHLNDLGQKQPVGAF
jgi:hypothetical protein